MSFKLEHFERILEKYSIDRRFQNTEDLLNRMMMNQTKSNLNDLEPKLNSLRTDLAAVDAKVDSLTNILTHKQALQNQMSLQQQELQNQLAFQQQELQNQLASDRENFDKIQDEKMEIERQANEAFEQLQNQLFQIPNQQDPNQQFFQDSNQQVMEISSQNNETLDQLQEAEELRIKEILRIQQEQEDLKKEALRRQEKLRQRQEQEEEERRRQEQEAEDLRKKQEEEAEERRRQEQEAEDLRKKQEEEAEERRRQEQEAEDLRKKQEEEAEERRRQEQEAEDLRKKQEEEAEERRRQEQEAEDLRKKQEEEAEERRRQEQEAEDLRKKQEQEAEERRRQEQEAEDLRKKQEQEAEERRKKQEQENKAYTEYLRKRKEEEDKRIQENLKIQEELDAKHKEEDKRIQATLKIQEELDAKRIRQEKEAKRAERMQQLKKEKQARINKQRLKQQQQQGNQTQDPEDQPMDVDDQQEGLNQNEEQESLNQNEEQERLKKEEKERVGGLPDFKLPPDYNGKFSNYFLEHVEKKIEYFKKFNKIPPIQQPLAHYIILPDYVGQIINPPFKFIDIKDTKSLSSTNFQPPNLGIKNNLKILKELKQSLLHTAVDNTFENSIDKLEKLEYEDTSVDKLAMKFNHWWTVLAIYALKATELSNRLLAQTYNLTRYHLQISDNDLVSPCGECILITQTPVSTANENIILNLYEYYCNVTKLISYSGGEVFSRFFGDHYKQIFKRDIDMPVAFDALASINIPTSGEGLAENYLELGTSIPANFKDWKIYWFGNDAIERLLFLTDKYTQAILKLQDNIVSTIWNQPQSTLEILKNSYIKSALNLFPKYLDIDYTNNTDYKILIIILARLIEDRRNANPSEYFMLDSLAAPPSMNLPSLPDDGDWGDNWDMNDLPEFPDGDWGDDNLDQNFQNLPNDDDDLNQNHLPNDDDDDWDFLNTANQYDLPPEEDLDDNASIFDTSQIQNLSEQEIKQLMKDAEVLLDLAKDLKKYDTNLLFVDNQQEYNYFATTLLNDIMPSLKNNNYDRNLSSEIKKLTNLAKTLLEKGETYNNPTAWKNEINTLLSPQVTLNNTLFEGRLLKAFRRALRRIKADLKYLDDSVGYINCLYILLKECLTRLTKPENIVKEGYELCELVQPFVSLVIHFDKDGLTNFIPRILVDQVRYLVGSFVRLRIELWELFFGGESDTQNLKTQKMFLEDDVKTFLANQSSQLYGIINKIAIHYKVPGKLVTSTDFFEAAKLIFKETQTSQYKEPKNIIAIVKKANCPSKKANYNPAVYSLCSNILKELTGRIKKAEDTWVKSDDFKDKFFILQEFTYFTLFNQYNNTQRPVEPTLFPKLQI